MDKVEAKKRIEKLKKVIKHHRYLYHVKDKQEISEAALDSLKHELYKLEQEHPDLITTDSPTQRIGGKPLPKFKKIKHRARMLSMEDVFSFEEFAAWYKRALDRSRKKSLELYVMPKLDGLAISLIYKKGILETAATRGDGQIGEDVTQNIKTIEAVPLELEEIKGKKMPDTIEVRGEIYFPINEFEKFNRQQKKKGAKEFANPRNAAAGSVRQLNSKVTAERKLSFAAWDLDADFGQDIESDEWALLEKMGFKSVPESKKCNSLDQVQKHWQALQKKRDKLNYWIDGVVVRVNDNEVFKKLGIVGKTPRGLIAWKFPAEETTTQVKEIEWFVGRTGALTPVAVVKPIQIGGTTVQHASLHNYDEIKRLDVREGDTVILYKAGDIIPKVKEVIKKLRKSGSTAVHPPRVCPVCGSQIEHRKDEVAIYCTNKRCFAQDKENVLHAARAFEIDGLGPQIIATFIEKGLMHRAPDLFTLNPDEIKELEGFAEKSAQKLVEEINNKKKIELPKFLVALGIRNVGEETAHDLARHFGSLNKIMSASKEELVAVSEVGDIVAESVYDFFKRAEVKTLIEDYKKNGVLISNPKKVSQKLDGKTFVLTGTLDALHRDDAKEKIRSLGGNLSGSVSTKTDYLVVGAEPGSKYNKAKKLGVSILSETQFLNMIR